MIRNFGPEEPFDNLSVNPSMLTEVSLPILYPCLEEGDVNVSSCFRASETCRPTKSITRGLVSLTGIVSSVQSRATNHNLTCHLSHSRGVRMDTTWAQTEESRSCWLNGFPFRKNIWTHTQLYLWLLCVWLLFWLLSDDRWTSPP